ncbi:MAG: ribonuclease H-like YkuK family protein [Candidatus Kerfeldbacteria bacterium]|nr:ribonuclease H-like YkuK family protein [Candidatus Kerfeldbacteria bacterium]
MALERFHSPSLGLLDFQRVVGRLTSFVRAHDVGHYRLIIGTDSLPSIDGHVQLVSAIVFHRIGRGGIYFWQRTRHEHVVTLRDRMYREALQSLALAKRLREHPQLQPLVGSLIEVHVDIGENGPTRQMIAEIVGMVTASGFTVRTKPDAYAASKVADRHTAPVYALAD